MTDSTYYVTVEGEEGFVATLDGLVEDNADDPELVAELRQLQVGQVLTGGGGAAAEFQVERLS